MNVVYTNNSVKFKEFGTHLRVYSTCIYSNFYGLFKMSVCFKVYEFMYHGKGKLFYYEKESKKISTHQLVDNLVSMFA